LIDYLTVSLFEISSSAFFGKELGTSRVLRSRMRTTIVADKPRPKHLFNWIREPDCDRFSLTDRTQEPFPVSPLRLYR